MAQQRKTSVPWYAVPMAVIALGVLSIGMLVWTDALSNRQRADFVVSGVIKDLRTKTATAHLWLEETFSDEDEANMALARSNLAEAGRLAEVLVNGGKTPHGQARQFSRDPELLARAGLLRTQLSEFTAIAEQRFAQAETAGPGSSFDAKCDAVFLKIQGTADALEGITEKKLRHEHAAMTWRYRGNLLAWSLLVLAATGGLLNREAKRKRAEEALKNTLDELEGKVLWRTRELGKTNEQLSAALLVRQRTETALRESEGKYQALSEQFHTLLDAIPDSITLLSPELRIVWANQGAVLAGRGAQVAGNHCYRLWLGTDEPCAGCPVLESFRTGRAASSQATGINGRVYDLRTFPVRDKDGEIKYVLEIAADITEQVAQRQEAERTAHLAALGELAAGVAHEINNPINGIINCAEILVSKSGEESREHDIGGRIIKEGSRIAYIVKSLLAFSRIESEDKAPTRVREMIEDTLALTRAQIKKEGIALGVEVDDELLVLAQPQRLEQVFLNIISNARAALIQRYPEKDEGKILTITARRVETDQGAKARIIFHDRGVGIPPKVMSRIMDPFFSTKPKGKGTGLGLSISHGIIENHGGKLTTDSILGVFTEVTVELPLLEER